MVNSGVKQGCALSPLLFIVVLNYAMRSFDQECLGLSWHIQGGRLGDLDFADDICLLSHRFSEMQRKLDTLVDISKCAGLKINVSKTKLLRVCTTSSVSRLKLGEQEIEEVDRYCYLGAVR